MKGNAKMMKQLTVTSIIAILLIGTAPFIHRSSAQATPELLIDPASIIDETLTPGETVVFHIAIADATNLYSYELKLFYKTSVLNVSSVVRPAGHFFQPVDPANQFQAKWETLNNFNATHGRLWLGFTLLFPETGKSGSGVLADVTFNIVGVDSTPLVLAETILADDLGSEVAHTQSNGLFSNVGAPPAPPPAFVYVDPASIADPGLTPSHNFSVSIKVINATDLFSFEFRLNYSATILEGLEIQEGNFLSNAGNTSILQNQTDNVLGSLLFSVGLVTPPGVTGDGTLATIVFHVIANGTTQLTLNGIVLKNSDNQVLNFTKANGSFSNLTTKPGDINEDGIVNLLDLVEAAISFGKTSADPPADPQNPRGWKPEADMNQDNIINIFDLILIVLLFGT